MATLQEIIQSSALITAQILLLHFFLMDSFNTKVLTNWATRFSRGSSTLVAT